MFILSEMRKTLRIPPFRFNMKLNDAIALDLREKLAGKVVKDVGLCVTLYDITKIHDSFILPGDGAAHTKVEFRLVIFRPFHEEVLVGKIKSCSEEGVRVTLGFFDEIIIPSECLQQPSRYDEHEELWVWEYDDGDKHDLFMDLGEPIRFRVAGIKFNETFKSEHKKPEENKETPASGASDALEKEKIPPYVITASISEPGLGLLSWWT